MPPCSAGSAASTSSAVVSDTTEPVSTTSFSLPPEGSDEETVLCPVRRLETIAADLGHERIDVLKMDIEGFEYGVIDDVLAGSLRPAQWLIEFHHNMMHFVPEQTRRAVKQLEDAGYRLFAVSNVGHEYSFVRS